MTVLIYRYGSICEPDIIETFRSLQVEVQEICEEMTDKSLTAAKRVELVSEGINRYNPVFVFSINFFPAIAEVCYIHKVPYFCWTVDSPIPELFSRSIQRETNRVFLFDRTQYNDFSGFNPDNIYHLPLAAAVERFDKVIQGASRQDLERFAGDISFVGSLYSEKNKLSKIDLPEYAKGYIDGVVESALKVYGYNFMEETLPEQIVQAIKENAPDFYEAEDSLVNPDRYVAAHFYAGYHAAEVERIRTLNTLAEHFKVDLYTRSDVTPLQGVIVSQGGTGKSLRGSVTDSAPARGIVTHGGVQTLTEMPLVFHQSRINLNMTIKPIQTGLPLRIFDIMGCGGFCMTNYQEELTDHFEIGVDLEAYGSLEELVDKCAYYLAHEEQRVQIARNGYCKVKEQHSYRVRVMEMLRKVL